MKQWLPALYIVVLLAGCAGVSRLQVEPPSRGTRSLHQGEIVIAGSDVPLTGFLYWPGSPGVHPAMQQLHGCSGFRNPVGVPNDAYRFWADHWVRLGSVVLILDSLAPRGENDICTQNARKIRVSVDIDVYPDAHHSFDRLRQPVRFVPNVGAGNKGAHVGTNAEAR